MTSQSSLTPPTVGERERRIQRARVMLTDAQMALDRLSRSTTQSDELFQWHTAAAQSLIQSAAHILRSIPKGEK